VKWVKASRCTKWRFEHTHTHTLDCLKKTYSNLDNCTCFMMPAVFYCRLAQFNDCRLFMRSVSASYLAQHTHTSKYTKTKHTHSSRSPTPASADISVHRQHDLQASWSSKHIKPRQISKTRIIKHKKNCFTKEKKNSIILPIINKLLKNM